MTDSAMIYECTVCSWERQWGRTYDRSRLPHTREPMLHCAKCDKATRHRFRQYEFIDRRHDRYTAPLGE